MAATQSHSFFSQKSRTLSRPLNNRTCPLLVPFLHRLNSSPSSNFTVETSRLSLSQTRRTCPKLSAWSSLEEARNSGDQIDEDFPLSIHLLPITSEEQFDSIVAKAQLLNESFIILWMAIWCRKCIYLKPKLEKLAADYCSRIRFYCVDVNIVPQKLVNRAGVTKMPTIQLHLSISHSFIANASHFHRFNSHPETDRPVETSIPHVSTFVRTVPGMTCSGQQVRSCALAGCAGRSNCAEQPIVTILTLCMMQLWRGSEKESEIFGGHEAWLVVNEVRKMIEKED